ncbi:MAG: iron ABC transporter permease [Spirochaetaceae bacterium]|nr:iron ABC transporter permease [Spirochaetaceae bacterium]
MGTNAAPETKAVTVHAKGSSQRKTAALKLLRQPFLVLAIIFIFALLAIFIIFPLFKIGRLSLTDDKGVFTLEGVKEIFSNRSYWQTFWNSIKLGLIVACISTFVGYIFAYATTRVKMPGGGFFKSMATLPIISPPFILSLSMIFLFGRQGLITKGLLHIEDFDVYGLPSLILVQSVSFFPVAYLTLTGILESIDSSVEDAALNLGASRWHIFRTVTLPLSVPGIASSFLLVFIQSLEDFSNPAVIAGRYTTLAVEAYRLITGMYDTRGGSILAIMLLVPTLIAFLLQKYWLNGKSFVTVTGKPAQQRKKTSDPHIVWPFFVICLLISLFIILLYGTVFIGAFVKTWGINYHLTLDHFRYVFSLGWDSLRNSIVLSTLATPITGILGMVIAYLVVRKKFPGRRVMEFTSMLTSAIPGTVLGIGYILAFNQKPFLFTGTAFILIMAFTFRNMPVGIESGTSTLMQIDKSIEEASTSLGAGSGSTFLKITLPLLKQAFFSGLVYSFVRSMTAVSSIIFLVSPRWNVATTRIFSLFEISKYSDAAAYSIIMIAVILVAISILNFLVLKGGGKKQQKEGKRA